VAATAVFSIGLFHTTNAAGNSTTEILNRVGLESYLKSILVYPVESFLFNGDFIAVIVNDPFSVVSNAIRESNLILNQSGFARKH
jgi:hypothetical protein